MVRPWPARNVTRQIHAFPGGTNNKRIPMKPDTLISKLRQIRPPVSALALGFACILTLPALGGLTHRYSFTNDVTDSVGGANGTLKGNVTITGGAASFPGVTN